ncbi:hypothetical protein T492DRAFT_872299 [Pavlovales sp. CCMP2436]|nr:hypothetical protein T492DRAFT_872299 [Pavlovales sp. CCMP2436]
MSKAEAEVAALKEHVVTYHADQAKKKAHADAHSQFAYLQHPVAIDGPVDLTDAHLEPLERVLFPPPAAIPAGARERPADYRSDDADYAELGDDECETAKEIARLMAEHRGEGGGANTSRGGARGGDRGRRRAGVQAVSAGGSGLGGAERTPP